MKENDMLQRSNQMLYVKCHRIVRSSHVQYEFFLVITWKKSNAYENTKMPQR